MIAEFLDKRILLLLILAYAVLAIGWNMHYSSASHDEALNIVMAGQALEGKQCPNCIQHTGSVFVHPFLAYLGSSAAGLAGARAVSGFFGICLILTIYIIARNLLTEKLALFSSLLLTFSGTTIYLSKLATYDMTATFFLALSFLFIVKAERPSLGSKALFLFAASLALFLATITKYVVAVFWIPLSIYVCWRQRRVKYIAFFLVPLLVAGSIYWYFAILPAMDYLSNSAVNPYKDGYINFKTLGSRIHHWLGIPYLLTLFSFFHDDKEWRSLSLRLFLLSTPVVILHLVTGDGRSVDKNVIFALPFLTPCAAIGLDHMSGVFSGSFSSRRIKSFLTGMLLLVVWAFGIADLRWLENHFPDVSPVIDFFRKKGFNGMTVAIDSDYGDPQNIYTYSLTEKFPDTRFFSTSYVAKTERRSVVATWQPEYLLFDEYYSAESIKTKIARYSTDGYSRVSAFNIRLPWGVETVQIFQRRER